MLTKEQERAASFVYGPVMVVAGPGSGKTKVLTTRIKNLLQVTEPERIVVFTFARKAAKEMKTRFAQLTDEQTAQRVEFGTFHSVFYRWLRRWGVLTKDMKLIEKEDRAEEDSPVLFASKWDGVIPFNANDRKRSDHETIDYEAILRLTDREIEKHLMWKEYDFFLIDEFQDIDPLQFSIVRKMVGTDPNLYVTGDEDQSIYAFRGSDPSIFLNFQKTFPAAERIDLSVNFRCAKKIVDLSVGSITHNRERFDKQIKAFEASEEGSVEVLRYSDDRQEMCQLSKRIARDPCKDIAVLCRTGQEALSMALHLEEAGLSVSCKNLAENGELYCPDLRHHVVLKREMDMLEQMAMHPDSKDLYRAIEPCLSVLTRSGSLSRKPNGVSLFETAANNDRIEVEDRLQLKELSWMLSRIAGKAPDRNRRRVYANVLMHTAYFSEALERTRKNGYGLPFLLRQSLGFVFPQKEIFVSTMHGAKGLEFEHVYLPSLVEGKCPRKEAIGILNGIEEERRLFYVALTRAKSKTVLSYYQREGVEPSLFLKEIGLA